MQTNSVLMDKVDRGDQHARLNEHSQPCFMGVDIDKVLHVVIRAAPDGHGARHLLFAGQVNTFDELGRLISQYNPACAVIDALPETKNVFAFQREHWGVVLPAYYPAQLKTTEPYQLHLPNSVSHRASLWSDNVFVWIDRKRMLDKAIKSFAGEVETPLETEGFVDAEGYCATATLVGNLTFRLAMAGLTAC
ncbi:MAG: hypothetical protein AAF639_16760 [Chloroflexota bacterium]